LKLTHEIFDISSDSALIFETESLGSGRFWTPLTEIHWSAWEAIGLKVATLTIKINNRASSQGM
jgi:hypothetical protein